MKVAILAGGLGSRLAEETDLKPKPMVEIGGKPNLWHILMHYGFQDFAIALGYKGEVIKKYMLDYRSLNRDLSISLGTSFWQCMDTLREKKYLKDLWEKEKAPWKTWEDQDAGIGYGTRRVYRDGVGSAVVERGA